MLNFLLKTTGLMVVLPSLALATGKFQENAQVSVWNLSKNNITLLCNATPGTTLNRSLLPIKKDEMPSLELNFNHYGKLMQCTANMLNSPTFTYSVDKNLQEHVTITAGEKYTFIYQPDYQGALLFQAINP
ncbi:MAG: hypothetical protein KIT27_00180 [Legionellales bacterium]|nr:hypothetical protein [Legionellales bacterium]